MDTEQGNIFDAGDWPSDFAMVPYMVLHLDISTYALKLYLAVIETIGANPEEGKACFKTDRTLSKEYNMSRGVISNGKKELLDAGLITIEKSDGHHYKTKTDGTQYCIGGVGSDVIRLVNIWGKNKDARKSRFSREK